MADLILRLTGMNGYVIDVTRILGDKVYIKITKRSHSGDEERDAIQTTLPELYEFACMLQKFAE